MALRKSAGSESGCVSPVSTIRQDLVLSKRLSRRQAVPERLPLQTLHDDEVSAFMLAEVVDGADVGVVQSGGGTCLALEALKGLGIGGELIR